MIGGKDIYDTYVRSIWQSNFECSNREKFDLCPVYLIIPLLEMLINHHRSFVNILAKYINAVQKNKCIRCYPTLVFLYICRISEAVRHSQAENVIFACLCAHLSLYLWNVRVEWHSWKYDFLLPLHFTFTIFELKLENTSARQNKIKASFVLLSSRLYVSLSLRR